MAKKHLNEGQENYNESKVFIPNNFVGIGNTNKGFTYNSAWNGRWKNGGEMNKRIKNIPSEGKYAKKTLPSAKDGKMLYYQQGLDFRPKSISKNGSELKKLESLAKDTGWLSKYEYGGELKKLDQLVNFSNYNKIKT